MLSTAPANAKRVALLIGNQTYADEVGPLKNPVNDVTLIARSLRQIGFSQDAIRVVKNASRRTILAEVDQYIDRVAAAGKDAVGFFYYSGHGAANRRDLRNYLIPVDAKTLDGSVWYDAVQLDNVVDKLKTLAPNAAHFVIFDACRNILRMPTKGAKGFTPISSRRGMLIAFSTDPGQTATDTGVGSGPYAAALAAELVKPGLDHVSLFQNVKERVVAKVRNQVPWERNGLIRRIYLAGPSPTKKQVAPLAPMSQAAIAWSVVERSKSCGTIRAYANQFSGTIWETLAAARLTELRCEETQPKQSNASLDAGSITPEKPEPEKTALATNPTREETVPKEEKDYGPDLQRALSKLGCYNGRIDGIWGPASRRALSRALGASARNAVPSKELLSRLKSVSKTACRTAVPRATTKKREQKSTPPKVSNVRSSGRPKSSGRKCLSYSQCLRDCNAGVYNVPPRWCAQGCSQGDDRLPPLC